MSTFKIPSEHKFHVISADGYWQAGADTIEDAKEWAVSLVKKHNKPFTVICVVGTVSPKIDVVIENRK